MPQNLARNPNEYLNHSVQLVPSKLLLNSLSQQGNKARFPAVGDLGG
jgi:hypothetical protein